MSGNAILRNNEIEANHFASKVMLISILFIALVFVLEVTGIFIVPMNIMIIALSASTVLLFIPCMLTEILKFQHPVMKYITVTSAALMVATMNLYLERHVVLMYIYPIAIASLFFSRKLSWYTVSITLVLSSLSQILAFNAGGVADKNFDKLSDVVIYGVVPRAIELLGVSIIFIMLSKRTRRLLQNMMSAEEQKKMLEKMQLVTAKSHEVSEVISQSMDHLAAITVQTTVANEQIAENTTRIADGSEETLRHTEKAVNLVDKMSGKLNSIASESSNIAGISQQLMQTNESSGRIIRSAVDEMNAIVAAAEESRRLIGVLGEKSNEIGRIVEVITSISERTNLLALNAAIESARAGEQGKGFAVVSEEIRKLAEQSKSATKDITKLIGEVLEDTGKTVEAINRSTAMAEKGMESINAAGKSFEQVYYAENEMNSKVQEVSGYTSSAAESGKNVAAIMHDIADITSKKLEEINTIAAACQEQVASMQHVQAAVETLNKLSYDLVEIIK